MKIISKLETKRLVLRQWRKEDLDEFALLNADPEVMEFFRVCSAKKRNELAEKINI